MSKENEDFIKWLKTIPWSNEPGTLGYAAKVIGMSYMGSGSTHFPARMYGKTYATELINKARAEFDRKG